MDCKDNLTMDGSSVECSAVSSSSSIAVQPCTSMSYTMEPRAIDDGNCVLDLSCPVRSSPVVKPGPSVSSDATPEPEEIDESCNALDLSLPNRLNLVVEPSVAGPVAAHEGINTGRSTPDPCSICISTIVNRSFTDSCMHEFCFKCLKRWSEIKPECPLCKQNFKSIYYNVRSVEDYQEYVLPISLRPPSPPLSLGLMMMNFPEEDRIDLFRSRMLREDVFSSYMQNVQMEDGMDCPILGDSARVRPRRPWQVSTSSSRHYIYRLNLWVRRHNNLTVRDCSPEFYRDNPAMVHRLVVWVNRELSVLCGPTISPHISNIILDLILRVHIQSQDFANRIARYTGCHTRHFVHEFYSYAISPYDLVRYERESHYVHESLIDHSLPWPAPTPVADEDVQEVARPPAAAPVLIDLPTDASDSDDCMIIDTVVKSSRTFEVITLNSDEDEEEDQVASTSTSETVSLSQPGTSGTARPGCKRCSRTSKRVNVKINIGLSSDANSSLDSDASPVRKRSRKVKKHKSKSGNKKKRSKKVSKNKCQKVEHSAPKYKPYRSKSVSPHLMLLPLKKRCPRLDESKSSLDDEPTVLQIGAEPELIELTETEVVEDKPRLRSVVVKPEIKTDIQDLLNDPSTSYDDFTDGEMGKKYHTYDSDTSTSSDFSYGSSYRRRLKELYKKH